MARFPLRFRLLFALLALIVLLAVTRSLWLPGIGYALVHDDGPARADAAIVLAGDYSGKRLEKAAQLARAGYTQAVLVDGSMRFYSVHECDAAIPYIVRKGYPQEWFVPLALRAKSTEEEAAEVLPELKRRNIRSILLVTSDYHTARARRTFLSTWRKLGGGPSLRAIAAPDISFQAASWWKTRESQKITYMEWSKTLANLAGL